MMRNTGMILAACLALGACSSLELAREGEPAVPLEPPKRAGPKVPAGDWMATYYTYPTGRFDPAWWQPARIQDEAIPIGRPEGVHAMEKSANLRADAFTPLGPMPVVSGNNGWAGRVNVIVVSPQPAIPGDQNSFRAYAATDGGGVWKTDNCCSDATTWRVTTDAPHIASSAIGELALDPNQPDTVYAGTGDLRFGSFSFGSAGLLKSTDAGETWRVLGEDVFLPQYPPELSDFPQYQAIGKVVVDPASSDRLVVGTKTGLYFSHDAGESWAGPCYTNAFVEGPGRQRQDITGLLALPGPAGSTRLYAAVGTRGLATPVQPDLDLNGANGVYRSTMPSSGCPASWQLVSRPDNGWPPGTGNGQPFGPLGRMELAAAPSAPEVIYAKAIDPQDFTILGVWISVDGGDNWELRATAANGFTGCPPGTQNWYNAGISVDPNQPGWVYLSAWDLFRSTNAAVGFENLTCLNNARSVHIDQHARAFVGGNSSRLLIGNDGGIYYSANALQPAVTFRHQNQSLNTIEFYAGDLSANFATAPTRGIVGGAQDNGTSVMVQSGPAAPAPWTAVFGGDGITARIEPVLGQRWYYSSQRGNIVLSTNGPAQPNVAASGPWNPGQAGPEHKNFLMPFDLYRYGALDEPGSGCTSAAGCTHLIAGTYRVWESTNGAFAPSAEQRWQAISPDLTKGTLVLGTDNRSVINTLAYAFSNRRVAIAGTMDGNVWFGLGLGQAPVAPLWRNVTGGNQVLPNRPIMKVVTDAQDPLLGYAAVGGFSANTPATPGHVFQVRCNADCSEFSWRNVSGNLPDIPFNAVMVNPHLPRQLFAGSDWGLYFTDNVEADFPIWQRFEGLPRVMIWDMQIDRGYTTLAVFTRARGAWVWPLPAEAAQPNLTGLWLAPGEEGWGLSVAHQGEVIAPVWYTYDSSGRPAWLLVSGATRQSDGSYLGPVFRFEGTPFSAISGPANDPGEQLGEARFRMLDSGKLAFDYRIGSVEQTKLLDRVAPGPIPACVFVPGSRADAGNRTDLWFNPAESGWGMQLIESGSLMFLAWYTYAADRQPMWVTGLLQRQGDGRFSGVLNRPLAGVPFSLIAGPATSFPVPEVGVATLEFVDGERGQFSYTLDGSSQTKPIERIDFAGPLRSRCQ